MGTPQLISGLGDFLAKDLFPALVRRAVMQNKYIDVQAVYLEPTGMRQTVCG